MCYAKPGPRCTAHALARLRSTKSILENAPEGLRKDIARFDYEDARNQYYMTTGGLEYLQKKIDESEDPAEKNRLKTLLSAAKSGRSTRIGMVKQMNAELNKIDGENSEEHQDEEISSRDKALNITLDKDPNLPATRYIDSIAPVQEFVDAYHAGLIDISEHPDPDVPYVTLDYSRQAQFANAWNEITVNARGLIINTETGEIVARPFRKFFNYGQPAPGFDEFDMSGPVVVTNKEDGSMGILYTNPDGTPGVATRGSMSSEQAKHASELYRERYEGKWTPRPDVTYLYEVIYPENRVVVDYGKKDDLVLIGAVDKNTGKSIPLNELNEWKGERAKQYEFNSLTDALQTPVDPDKEGYVVHFTDNDQRVKIKGENYLRLHKIMTNITAVGIWEKTKDDPTDSWVHELPDEFGAGVKKYADSLRLQYNERLDHISSVSDVVRKKFNMAPSSRPSDAQRKEIAQYIQSTNDVSTEDKPLVLALIMSDGTNPKLARSLWAKIKPKGKIDFLT